MADFKKWTDTPGNRRYDRLNGSILYSDHPADQGNYNSLGQLVGTMRSISAPAYESWIGRPPSAADMQSITVDIAKQIYKAKFWDEVQGDKINSQIIAEMAADMKSSAGGNGIKQLQKALGVTQDGQVGPGTLAAINKADSATLYEQYRQNMLEYYAGLGGYWLEGWQRDMDKYYPERSPQDPVFKDTSKVFSLQRVTQPQNVFSDSLISIIIFLAVFYAVKRKFFVLLALILIPFVPPL